jgi:glycosyltransferase involved in cell wall biosynthesis
MADRRILLLSRYGPLGASSRLRSLQYLPHLRECGLEIDVEPLFDDDYLQRIYAGRRPSWMRVASSYADRLLRLLHVDAYDIVWVEKELFPWLPAFVDLLLARRAPKLVLDFDDAIFHRYEGHRSAFVRRILGRKIDALMGAADLVLVGNDYLAARAASAGARRVELLPTVVDTRRYQALVRPAERPFTVGWIGTPRTAAYLKPIEKALHEVAAETGAHFVIVGAGTQALPGLPNVEHCPWSEASEASDLQRVDVGLMPLPDEPFERGKCGYKLVQYMASGKSVVASPVGVNTEIVEPGLNGFLASSTEEWRESLLLLASDPGLCARQGAAGRRKAEQHYSLFTCQRHLAGLLLNL